MRGLARALVLKSFAKLSFLELSAIFRDVHAYVSDIRSQEAFLKLGKKNQFVPHRSLPSLAAASRLFLLLSFKMGFSVPEVPGRTNPT